MTGFKDYFSQGVQQQQEYEKRKQARMPQRRKTKLPWYSPASVIIGAGVLYQMLKPFIQTIIVPIVKGWIYIIQDTIKIIRGDIRAVRKKIPNKPNPEWEAYKRFEELTGYKK